ncbi:sensor histidine kinase [Paenibacillus chartarius]|uniref:histidine kinase n=1 Tax=Paenibacillus chartarius TaxID=747481 RepID=A0ABV6DFT7_9BACL
MKLWGPPRHWFRNQLIRSKIFLVYIPLLMVPLFVLGYVAVTISTKAIVSKTIDNVSDNANLILTRMDGMFTNAESCANMLTLNINRLLVRSELPDGRKLSELQLYNELSNQLRFAQLVFPDVESAVFVDSQQRVYVSELALERRAELAAGSELLRTIELSNGSNVWFPMQRRDFFVKNEAEPVLSLGKKIINIDTGQQLGLLVLNIRERDISNVYRQVDSLSGSYFVTDAEGLVISSQMPEERLLPVDSKLRGTILAEAPVSRVERLQGTDMLIVSSKYERFDWHLVTRIPMKQLTADNGKIIQSIVWIGLAVLLIALLSARILAQVIVRPLMKLAKAMRGFTGGSLEVEIEVDSSDEIGHLAAGFNTMLRRMRELLAQIRAEQRKKREIELALIQSQIKPHFLYNTLDVIYTLSEMGRSRDVQKTTKALADFYRVVLSGGREEITVEDEIRNVKDYLAIQRIRYFDVFDYEIEVHSDVLKKRIPKLTVQPLVENAIYHGLKEKGSFGTLSIRGWMEGAHAVLQVSDDGVGMTAEQAARLLQPPGGDTAEGDGGDVPGKGSSFGLRSVDARLRLSYGEEYGLSVESSPGAGTIVSMKLPN